MRSSVILLAAAILLLSIISANAGDIPVDQASLTSGTVYEINRDDAGKLYVTNWGAGQIWRVDPVSSTYSRFDGLGRPNDARPDSAGNIWFTDWASPMLGRISVGPNPTLTTWDLSTWDPSRTFNLGGLAIDANGWIWFSELGEAGTQLLYRFNPGTKRLCGYTLPNGIHSFYILNYGGYLWLGDWVQGRIFQVDPTNMHYNYWDAAAVGEPRGLAADGDGFIWWADKADGASKLVRLEPTGQNSNRFTTYSLPVSATPYMVAERAGQIWYTAEGIETSNVGILLDPDLADQKHSSKNPVPGVATPVSICDQTSLGEGNAVPITPVTGALTWRGATWTDVTPAGKAGWTVFETAWGGVPYGILAETNYVWVTDQLYQQFVRVTLGLGAPYVVIATSGASDLQLNWAPVNGALEYRGWVGSQPYFEPTGVGQLVTSPWPQPGVMNVTENYYYAVRSAAGGNVSIDSNRVGKFSFTLTKGSG
jgi:streptogramin lyase